MPDALRVAYLGCGFITDVHSRHARKLGGLVIPSYASRDLAKADAYCRRHRGAAAFGDYRAAIESRDVDAVVIAVPPKYHRDLALQALAAGKHVLVEKPAFLTLADYRIQTGDELDIVFPLNPELTVRTFVRPDGMISLELVDEIRAEGLTTGELTEHLLNAYSTEIRDPDISVNPIRSAKSTVICRRRCDAPGSTAASRPRTTASVAATIRKSLA